MDSEQLKKRIWWTWLSLRNIVVPLLLELWNYYVTPYPLLLIRGSLLRLIRRLKSIWFPKPRSRGRPRILEEIIDLILDMKRANLGWGSLRISNELKILGIMVSKTTVLKVLRKNGFVPPKTRCHPISWTTFLRTYKTVWFADFTTVFDAKGCQVFIFNIIDGATRQLVLTNATLNPNRDWVMQQIRNCQINGYRLPEAFVHDRDAIFGKYLDRILVDEFNIVPLVTGYKRPWENGPIERYHLTLKSEILWRVPILDVNHVRSLCLRFQAAYNDDRTHQSLDGRFPSKGFHEELEVDDLGQITKRPLVDGLITIFRKSA